MSYQKLPPAAAVEALRSFTIAHMLLPEVIEESGRDRGWDQRLENQAHSYEFVLRRRRVNGRISL